MKKLILLLGLLIGFVGNSKTSVQPALLARERNFITQIFNVKFAVETLKTKPLYLKKDRAVLDSLTYHLFDNFIADTVYMHYDLSKQEFISCIQAISMFESSIVTKKGSMPFKSSLFVKVNNPFGIKFRRGYTKGSSRTVLTTEIINGEAKKIYAAFQGYSTMDDAVDELMRLLLTKRYIGLRTAKDTEQFFHQLRHAGYHTAGIYYTYALIKQANIFYTHV